ncbi:hypothetical protein [Corynebacterium caspium]|uniref:hypothetical protein n=1 Tax=Corynebacterium caspium TaxID=234828 RepID=UPI000370B308|nr:hypothetical protein CCASP_05500 [Corynebacterium caspium DSM 44850]
MFYTILLILHAIFAVLFLGTVTVAISSFPRHIMIAQSNSDVEGIRAGGAARQAHKITNLYGMLSLIVPLLGVAVMFTDMSTYFRDGRYHTSILLAVIGWAILFFMVIPRQKKMLGALQLLPEEDIDTDEKYQISDWAKAKSQLAMFSGLFALTWVLAGIIMFLPANFGL